MAGKMNDGSVWILRAIVWCLVDTSHDTLGEMIAFALKISRCPTLVIPIYSTRPRNCSVKYTSGPLSSV